MKTEININIPSINIAEAKNNLAMIYIGAIIKGEKLKNIPAPFLWGPPGVGKSASVYQLAEEIEKQSGKRVVVTEVRLLLYSPVDLRGVPVADSKKEFTNWLKPRIFDLDSGDDCVNILFLDELSAAPQSVQAAAYQICLDRKIGEFELAQNTIVIAAGNRTCDSSISYKMPKALANRLLHFDILADFATWRNWAVKNNISDKIISYLAFSPERLCAEPQGSELAYPTPRSWAFVSSLLTMTGKEPDEIAQLIAGCVGEDTALEFIEFCKGNLKLPDINEIFRGVCKEKPTSYDGLYALTSKLTREILNRAEEISDVEIENVCKYMLGVPNDFMTSFILDINTSVAINHKLMRSFSFHTWLVKNEDVALG